MAWAVEQKITQTSPQSHLLLILASYANDMGECYPSIKTMSNKTRLNEKTVRKCIGELIELGLLSDTKKVSNFGAKIYCLNLNLNTDLDKKSDANNDENTPTPPTKNGSPTNFGGVPNLVAPPYQNWEYPPTTFGSTPLPKLVANPIINHKYNHKENHKSDYTHTHENENSQNEKSSKRTKTQSVDKPVLDNKKSKSAKQKDHLTADDIFNLKLSDCNFSDDDFEKYPNLGDWIFENMDYQIIKDYLATREKKLTLTGIKRSIREASIAKLTLCQALEICITTGKGWQSFTAEYYFNSLNRRNNQPTFANQPRTFDEQGNIYATHQPNHQQNHQPHPNSTTAYVQRLSRDVAELKHELYGHPLPTHFGAING